MFVRYKKDDDTAYDDHRSTRCLNKRDSANISARRSRPRLAVAPTTQLNARWQKTTAVSERRRLSCDDNNDERRERARRCSRVTAAIAAANMAITIVKRAQRMFEMRGQNSGNAQTASNW